MANVILNLAILPMAYWRCKGLSWLRYAAMQAAKEKADVNSRIVRTFGSESRERKGSREVPRNRTCDGQSRNDYAYMVRTKVGADDLWHIRRVQGRKRTPGSSEWCHSQSAHGASGRTVLQTTGDRED